VKTAACLSLGGEELRFRKPSLSRGSVGFMTRLSCTACIPRCASEVDTQPGQLQDHRGADAPRSPTQFTPFNAERYGVRSNRDYSFEKSYSTNTPDRTSGRIRVPVPAALGGFFSKCNVLSWHTRGIAAGEHKDRRGHRSPLGSWSRPSWERNEQRSQGPLWLRPRAPSLSSCKRPAC